MSPQSISDNHFSYSHAGRLFGGHWHAPARAARGGVLVLHGGSGLSGHERRWSARLATAGYAAFAPDLFGEAFRDREHALALIGGLAGDPDLLRGRLAAALQALCDRTGLEKRRTAALGFCFGGMAALEMARAGAPIGAAISLHGGVSTRRPAQPGAIAAEILVCAGADDPFAPAQQRLALEAELTAAGARWTMLVLGGAQHGFTHRDDQPAPGNAYDATAERASWRATLDLLGRRLPTG